MPRRRRGGRRDADGRLQPPLRPEFRIAAGARIADGAIGELEIVSITSRDPGPPPISYIARSGGLFRDMMIHDFDMARFLLGEEPVAISAMGSALVDKAIGEAGDVDTAVVIMETKSGKVAQISNSRRAAYGYDQRIEAHGSKGMIRADNIRETTRRIRRRGGLRQRQGAQFLPRALRTAPIATNSTPSLRRSRKARSRAPTARTACGPIGSPTPPTSPGKPNSASRSADFPLPVLALPQGRERGPLASTEPRRDARACRPARSARAQPRGIRHAISRRRRLGSQQAAHHRDHRNQRPEGRRGAGRGDGDGRLPHRRLHAVGRRSRGHVPRDPRPRGRRDRARDRRRRDLAESRRPRHSALHARMPAMQNLPVAALQPVHGDPRDAGPGPDAGPDLALLLPRRRGVPLHGLLDLLEFHRAAGDRARQGARGRAVRQDLLHRLRRHHRRSARSSTPRRSGRAPMSWCSGSAASAST